MPAAMMSSQSQLNTKSNRRILDGIMDAKKLNFVAGFQKREEEYCNSTEKDGGLVLSVSNQKEVFLRRAATSQSNGLVTGGSSYVDHFVSWTLSRDADLHHKCSALMSLLGPLHTTTKHGYDECLSDQGKSGIELRR
jgi:hypothetical protein